MREAGSSKFLKRGVQRIVHAFSILLHADARFKGAGPKQALLGLGRAVRRRKPPNP